MLEVLAPSLEVHAKKPSRPSICLLTSNRACIRRHHPVRSFAGKMPPIVKASFDGNHGMNGKNRKFRTAYHDN